jgi:hypothetical protein
MISVIVKRTAVALVLGSFLGPFIASGQAADGKSKAESSSGHQRWALLIGINEYANVQSLRYCVADQEALAKQLIATGFPKDQVYLMADRAEKQSLRPSKLNVEKQLELVLGMPSEGDTIVLGFSGHGVQIQEKSYICPADCDLEQPQDSMIPLDRVFDRLSSCKASLKLLIVDACRNNVEIGGKRTIDPVRSLRAFGEALEKPPDGISLLTSCSSGQFAREHDKLGHGVFMHFVLEGLAGQAADEDGIVRLGHLLDYTSLKTQKYVYDQFNAAQRPYYKLEGSGPAELARVDRSTVRPAENPKLGDGSGNSTSTGTRKQAADRSALGDAADPEKSYLTAIWRGNFTFPKSSNRDSINFSMIIIQNGSTITGMVREPNANATPSDPWLHATFRGTFDETTLKINWTKTYDGTANADNDVAYSGRLSGDGTRVLSGAWQVSSDFSDHFTMGKEIDTHAGRWSGYWSGTQTFPETPKRSPLKFTLIIVEKGKGDMIGYCNERNTSGKGDDPWVHSTVRGHIDDPTGQVVFTKAYDGTAGVTDQIEFKGTLADDAQGISGTWKPTKGSGGAFEFTRTAH